MGFTGAVVEHIIVHLVVLELDPLEAAVETRVGQVVVDGGLVDGHVADADGLEGLGHVRVAPRDGRVLAQLDALALAASVERPGRDSELSRRLLDGGAAADGFEGAGQVVRVPGGGRRVEGRRQLDALLARDLVEGAAGDVVLLGGAVGRDASGAQLAQRHFEVGLAPRLGLVVLLGRVDAQSVGALPQRRRGDSVGRGRFRQVHRLRPQRLQRQLHVLLRPVLGRLVRRHLQHVFRHHH